jgi:hypothetical protein
MGCILAPQVTTEPHLSQPGVDTMKQRRSTRPFIPTDLVQNTAEYLGRVAGLLSVRGVSTEWQGAVSDAVGFLNGRCWDRLEYTERLALDDSDELWARLRLDDAGVVARCAVLCLRPRLETVACRWSRSIWFPLRLLGEPNETLVALTQHDSRQPVIYLSPGSVDCWRGCTSWPSASASG